MKTYTSKGEYDYVVLDAHEPIYLVALGECSCLVFVSCMLELLAKVQYFGNVELLCILELN